ncbi:MAG: ATP-binding protein [Rhodocyclaceae bacterium]
MSAIGNRQRKAQMAAGDAIKPAWWAKAYSLTVEIALAFGVLIALMLALGAAFYFSEQRSAFALDKLLKSDGRMADLSLRSALAMFKAGNAESDFLRAVDQIGVVEARERHVLQMQSHLIDMREYLTSIRILSSDPDLLNDIMQIEQQVQQYEDGFLAFVDFYGKPGQIDTANKARQDYANAALSIESLLEDLHTTASRRAIQTLSGVESAANITRWTIFITVSIAILLGAIVATIVWRRITGSVSQLIRFSGRVAVGDFSARAQQSKEHEFAILAQAMNQMAESLENSQAQLLAAARQAGMAEIATNVLHNVGNVLNSVNVSAGVLGSQVRASKAQGLARVVQMIDEHAADLGDFLTRDEKGKRLPDYLGKLAGALAAEQQSLLAEIGQLSKSIEHIKAIVATQQAYAGAVSVVETVRVGDLIDDALRMSAGALARHEVTVLKEFAELPALSLDRHRVLQILVNLISNAKQAMDVTTRPHRMTLRVAVVDAAGDAAGRRLQICVADEGEGIAPENLTRIFNHGFTTRKNGHGFGLHSCALAAIEMGGRLSAASDGPGQGAMFTLDLPLHAAPGTT